MREKKEDLANGRTDVCRWEIEDDVRLGMKEKKKEEKKEEEE